jgi:hypothetical protein
MDLRTIARFNPELTSEKNSSSEISHGSLDPSLEHDLHRIVQDLEKCAPNGIGSRNPSVQGVCA